MNLQVQMSRRFLKGHFELLKELLNERVVTPPLLPTGLISKDDANAEYLAFAEVVELLTLARDRRITIAELKKKIEPMPIASIYDRNTNRLVSMV